MQTIKIPKPNARGGIRHVLLLAAMAAAAAIPASVSAMPYASCITNTGNTVSFYLNEAGGNVTVTYEDGTTNASFNGQTTGVALPSGGQSFSLAGHTSYDISVTKVGTGKAAVTATYSVANSRGIDVNKLPTSPYFGQIYAAISTQSNTNGCLRRFNSDLTLINSNSAGVAWVTGSGSSPYRLAVNDDGYLTVGDYASAHSGVWRIDPTLASNQLLLGPISDANGATANSHGSEFSRPLLVGNLASGGSAVLYTVDAGNFPFNSSQLNSILVYSNITLATLPRETQPDLLGPETCLNLVLGNNYPGITAGPNGYIYVSNRRDGPSGGTATLQVYDANLNLLWNSLYNGGVNDYFTGSDTPGGTTTGPADSAVSPDGKYVAALGYGDNHIIVCSLTNGIPDVSTLYLIVNTISTTLAGRGLCWDAADNVYVSSSGASDLQEWTLGFTATATTTGNASGVTGFSLTEPSTVVGVLATNSIGTTILSQPNNYGNPTNATFVLTRSGALSSPLVVPFTLGGTAPAASYTASATGSITFAAGQSTTNITITAVNDGIPRLTTTVTLTVSATATYSTTPSTATLALLNTAPPALTLSVTVPSMYNAFSNDYAAFTLTRLGDTNAAAFTASSFTYGGTAVAGVDFTLAQPLTFNPGDVVLTNYLYPLSNGQPPVDSTTNPYVGNKTAVVGVAGGSGFSGATNTATLTILDSANPTTTVLFADPLTDPNDAKNWGVLSANNNMQTNPVDDTITFGYDLQNGDPYDYGAIPLPPSGAATALRVTVNKNVGSAAGVNLYYTNASFSGNYAVRFSMNVIDGYSTPPPASTGTEGPLFGIDASGTATNWWSGSAILSGWGTPPTNVWEADGIWYWICADGGAGLGDYLEFTALGGALPNTGWNLAATQSRANFANNFKTNVFTGFAGAGLPVNMSVLLGYSANNWADVEIRQVDNIVTMSIDKIAIFTYSNTNSYKSGYVMLGYDDPFSSIGAPDGAVYFSNLRVVSLAAPIISQIVPNGANMVINFSTTDGDSTPASFTVQSAATLTAPFTAAAGATVTLLSPGAFQAVVPKNGATEFYRILQN